MAGTRSSAWARCWRRWASPPSLRPTWSRRGPEWPGGRPPPPPVAGALVGAAPLVAAGREWLGGLRRQLAVLGLLVGVQLAIAVVLFIDLMFVSKHDAFFSVLVAAYTGLLGVAAGRLTGRRALGDLDRIRATL